MHRPGESGSAPDGRKSPREVKRALHVGGVATLVEQKRGSRNPHPNRVAPDIEQRILDFSLHQPTRGPQ